LFFTRRIYLHRAACPRAHRRIVPPRNFHK
jgi:hypothetical protein